MSFHSRTGVGFDVHPFDASRKLVLAGVHIADAPGLRGHSDADVICHAITDAVLGAALLGDMGTHFPDTSPEWKGADSIQMLARAVELAKDAGLVVVHADFTLVAEQPRIAPYREQMRANLEDVLHAEVNVKASRAEGLGAIGRVEGAACYAVATLSSVR